MIYLNLLHQKVIKIFQILIVILIILHINKNKGRCITFWYSMNSGAESYLDFTIHDISSDIKYKLWQLENKDFVYDLSSEWHYGSLSFYMENTYTILISGKTIEEKSRIAIDDIFFRESEYCSFNPLLAKTNTSLQPPSIKTTTKQPMTTLKPQIYDCDFESVCNWENSTSKLKWLIQKGNSNKNSYLPNIDHT